MQQQEDQNFIDAWKNGGEVNGKKVNDARLLAHFRQRRNALSKDDPLWDEWDNRLTQYTFAIEESKMSLKWDQHKVSEREMSQFYQRWAAKATNNSEFKRTLQSSAAKWLTAAKQRAASGSSGSKEEAHDSWVKNFYERHVAAGELLEDALIEIAVRYQAAPQGATSLADINPDSAGYERWLDIYYDGKTNDKDVQDGIEDLTRDIRKYDPDFVFDQRHVDDQLDRANEGLGTLVRRSIYKTERDDWQERRGNIRQTQNNIRQAPALQRVFDAQDQFNEEINNCRNDPYCERNAAVRLRDKLVKQQAKLLRGGQEAYDETITPLISGTIRVLNRSIPDENGKTHPLDPTKPEGQDATIFDIGETSGGNLQTQLSVTDTNVKTVERGGWLSSWAMQNQDGTEMLDDNGNPIYYHIIHDPSDLVPTDAVPITAGGSLDGGPAGVRVYSTPRPVGVVYTDPGGKPIDPSQVQTKSKDENDNEVVSDPGPGMAAYYELPGYIGPDGVARTQYRVGSGTPEDPFVYSSLKPIVRGADGRPVQPRTDPETGMHVYATSATFDPAAGKEGKGGWVADVTNYQNAGEEAKTKTPNGAYQNGSFRTPSGAATQQAIDDMAATQQNPEQIAITATKLAGAVGYDAAMAAQRGDTAEAEALTADAAQLALHSKALASNGWRHGAQADATYEQLTQFTPDQQAVADDLTKAGITQSKYGLGEVFERIRAMTAIDRWEQSQQGADAEAEGMRQLDTIMYGRPLHPEGKTVAQRAASMRGRVTDPRTGLDELRIPTYTAPGAPKSLFEQLFGIGGNAANGAPSTPGGLSLQERQAANLRAPGSYGIEPPEQRTGVKQVPESYSWEDTSVRGAVARPPRNEPKPDKTKEEKDRQSKNPNRPNWQARGGTKTIVDVQSGGQSYYDPTTGTVHAAPGSAAAGGRPAGSSGVIGR